MLNSDRLAATFRVLAETSSLSRREAKLAAGLRRDLEVLGR